MEPEDSLPYTQVPATCPYPKPLRSSPYQFHGENKLNDNIIIQDLPPNWNISFLEFYGELMHYFVVFPFFLKHLTNAE